MYFYIKHLTHVCMLNVLLKILLKNVGLLLKTKIINVKKNGNNEKRFNGEF